MKLIVLLLCSIVCWAYKVDKFAGNNGEGLLANSTSIGAFFHLQIDKRNNLYGCDSTAKKIRIIEASTGKLGTFTPSPWQTCSDFLLDFDRDVLFVADDILCKIFAVNLLTKDVTVVAGNGTCQVPPDGAFVFGSPIGQVQSITQTVDGTFLVGFRDEPTGAIRAINNSGIILTPTGNTIIFANHFANVINTPRSILLSGSNLQRTDFDINFNFNFAPAFAFNGNDNTTGEGLPVEDTKLGCIYVSTDSKGNIYTSEFARVRIVDTNLTVFTIAGTTENGYSGDGGLATNATLFIPNDVVIDSEGNILILDQSFTTIRKVDPKTKIITTLAGTGFPHYSGDGGPALLAQFDHITSVYEDQNGDFLIADTSNHVIRKITASSGIVSTIAGIGYNGNNGVSTDGTLATKTPLEATYGVAQTKNGEILFIDLSEKARVRKIEKSSGNLVTLAGDFSGDPAGDGGLAINAAFSEPISLAVDSQDNIYVCDQRGKAQSLRKIDHSTSIITSLGNGAIVACSAVHAANDGNIYASSNGTKIFKISAEGAVTVFAGNGINAASIDGAVAVQSPLNDVSGVTADIYGNVYFVESTAVKKIDATGVISTVLLRNPGGKGQISYSRTLNSLVLVNEGAQDPVLVISDLQNVPIASIGVALKESAMFLIFVVVVCLLK